MSLGAPEKRRHPSYHTSIPRETHCCKSKSLIPCGAGHLVILPSQGGSALRGMGTFPTSKVTILPQHVIVGEAFVLSAFRSLSGIAFHFCSSRYPRQMSYITFSWTE